MQTSKENALKMFAGFPKAPEKLGKMSGNIVEFDVYSPQQFKTLQQNRLFHALLTCFNLSGCSSFANADDMRLYYKRVAGLVKKQGAYLVESSWADATKEQAKTAIELLKRDMDLSGVIGSEQGKKYEQILIGINEFIGL